MRLFGQFQAEVRRRPLPRTSERKSYQGPERARAGGKHHLMPCFLSDGTEKTPAGWQSEGTEDRRAEAFAEFWADNVPSAPPVAVPMAEAVVLRALRSAAR